MKKQVPTPLLEYTVNSRHHSRRGRPNSRQRPNLYSPWRKTRNPTSVQSSNNITTRLCNNLPTPTRLGNHIRPRRRNQTLSHNRTHQFPLLSTKATHFWWLEFFRRINTSRNSRCP